MNSIANNQQIYNYKGWMTSLSNRLTIIFNEKNEELTFVDKLQFINLYSKLNNHDKNVLISMIESIYKNINFIESFEEALHVLNIFELSSPGCVINSIQIIDTDILKNYTKIKEDIEENLEKYRSKAFTM